MDLKIKLFITANLKQVPARYVTEAGTSIVSIVANEKQASETLVHPWGIMILFDTFTFSKALFDRLIFPKYCNSFNETKVLFANIVPMGLKWYSNTVLIPSGLNSTT